METSPGAVQHELHSRLILDKADTNHDGLYECEVTPVEVVASSIMTEHGHHQQQTMVNHYGDKLRKLFGLLVNGK